MTIYDMFDLNKDSLEELVDLTLKFSRETKGIKENESRVKRELRSKIEEGKYNYPIAKLGQHIIGYILYKERLYRPGDHKRFKVANIIDHYVTNKYRYNLVGSFLLEYALKYLKLKSYKFAFISIESENEKIKGIKSFGFEPIGEKIGYTILRKKF
ncbi:MAG: GNAT family N-acetyltransferase [Candidatus Woesearchaeota archaeon]